MKSLFLFLTFVTTPAFASDTYTCTAADSKDRVQTATFEIGQSGPIDYAKIEAPGRTVSGVPVKTAVADGATTYTLSTPVASYVISFAKNGDASLWTPSNSNFMNCRK